MQKSPSRQIVLSVVIIVCHDQASPLIRQAVDVSHLLCTKLEKNVSFYSKIFVPPVNARRTQHIKQNETVFLDIICLIVTKSKSAWNQLQNVFLKN